MDSTKPTIKGLFVKSHVNALAAERGEAGLNELRKRFGKPIDFKNSDTVPINDEVVLLECIVDILSGHPLSPQERSEEAGRLHFKNFRTTPLGIILFSTLANQPKLLLMQSKHVAGHVFQGVQFTAEDMGQRSVKITMTNNDYPVEHFKGFFEEWIGSSDYKGIVLAKALGRGVYEYLISWETKT